MSVLIHNTCRYGKSRSQYIKTIFLTNHVNIYLRLNEVKRNERDDKWFPEFPSEMIVCGSVVIVNMCEA